MIEKLWNEDSAIREALVRSNEISCPVPLPPSIPFLPFSPLLFPSSFPFNSFKLLFILLFSLYSLCSFLVSFPLPFPPFSPFSRLPRTSSHYALCRRSCKRDLFLRKRKALLIWRLSPHRGRHYSVPFSFFVFPSLPLLPLTSPCLFII